MIYFTVRQLFVSFDNNLYIQQPPPTKATVLAL